VLTCREAVSRLADLDRGGSPGTGPVEVRRHLGRCLSCRRYRRAYQTAVALAREAFRGAAVPEIPEDLVVSILDAARRRPFLPPLRLVPLLSGIAAAAPLLAFSLR
jgi:predicted anti-sigma-YlaC factor YlaD